MKVVLLVLLAYLLGWSTGEAGNWPWMLQALRFGACFFTGYMAAEYGKDLSAKERRA